jgi:hypothetical protein
MCDTRNINHAINNACTDVFRCLDADLYSSSEEVPVKLLENIPSMICCRIHSSGMDPATAQSHNNQGSFTEDILEYVPEMLILQPYNSGNCLCSFVPATDASMQFSAVLSMGGSAIASSS